MKSISYIFLFALLISSCTKFDTGGEIITNVEIEYDINMIEQLTDSGRVFNLEVRSVHENPCSNAYLDYTTTQYGFDFFVEIKDVIKPDNCEPGEHFPEAAVAHDNMQNGYYQVRLMLPDDVINEGSIQNGEDEYVLSFYIKNGIRVVNQSLLKIPEKVYWGYIASDDKNFVVKNHVEALRDFSGVAPVRPGNYGHFKLTSEREVVLRDDPNTANYQTFVFGYQTLDDLEAFISDFTLKYGENAKLNIFTAEGKVFKI